MKTLAIFALSTIAAAAFAADVTGPTSTITITGSSTQVAHVNGGYATNTANARTYANQNVASNKGNVDIMGTSAQTAMLYNSIVTNEAKSAGDVAVQNLASNVGHVQVATSQQAPTASRNGHPGSTPGQTIKGNSEQFVTMSGGTLVNEANSTNGCYGSNCNDTAIAYQNAASNMGDVSIVGTSKQAVSISNSTATNKALGKNTVAVQNLSSNYGNVEITGTSIQSTVLSNGAVLANLATGDYARAYQNFATNDSCDPPPTVCVGPACGLLASN